MILLHQFKHDGLDTVHKLRGMMTIYDKLNEINAGWSVNSGSLVLQSTNSNLNDNALNITLYCKIPYVTFSRVE